MVIGGRGRSPVRARHARASEAGTIELASRLAVRPAPRDRSRSLRPMGVQPLSSLPVRPHASPGADARATWARIGGAIARNRALVPLPLVAWAALAGGSRGATGWTIGAALVLAGLALRLAASAALARERGRLATWGAYAWLRHPHDLGTAAAWLGLAVAAGVGALLPGLVVALVLLFGLSARAEDRALEARFGEDWARWRRRTPAWIPRQPVAALAAGVNGAAAWSAERSALAGFAALLVAVALGTFAR